MATSEPTSDDGFELIDHLKHPEPSIQNLIHLILTKFPELAKDAQKELDEALEAVRTNQAKSDGIENKQLRSENKQLRSENKQLISENKQLNSKNKQHLKRLEELKEKKSETESKCRDELYNLQQKINEQEKEICKVKRNRPEEKTFAKRGDTDDAIKLKLESYDTIALQLRQTQDKLRETEAELDATKTRLSKSMGDKLTDNNPNIADLSDNNRPTKLAEKFQELYDNQWTDAFEIVYSKCEQGDNEQTEKKATAKLINILVETFRYCEKHASLQTKAMQDAVVAPRNTNSHIPTNVQKQIKDCRRNVAVFSGKHLFQKYQDELESSSSSTASMAKSIPGFIEECFNICWLMTVQDPPLEFGPNIDRGKLFNTDMYKAYTKSGSRIDFVVWPALLLHKNGPVLTKGIAQGLVDQRRERSGSAHRRSDKL